MESEFDCVSVEPITGLDATVQVPGSKSITNRALVCAAMAQGRSTLTGALDSEDTGVMIRALGQLGVGCSANNDRTELRIDGCGGRFPEDSVQLHVANSGTTMRFLTALLAASHGRFRVDGIARMRERPIADLLSALQTLGGGARSEKDNGCPPVVLDANGLNGGVASIRGDISSQFLSGLLMASPLAASPVRLLVEGPLVSQPYVRMTMEVMKAFGVCVSERAMQQFEISAPSEYRATSYSIEPDASAASYFWAVAAIAGGRVAVQGLGPNSLQGDVAFCDCLERMGCVIERRQAAISVQGPARHGIDVDMNAISDTVQTLAAVALFVDSPTVVRGVAHIRHKETDRIADLAREIRKLGAHVAEFEDGLRITPGVTQPATIETYNDHRMAMSLALAGLRIRGVRIRNPRCTEKTYPHFFNDLRQLGE